MSKPEGVASHSYCVKIADIVEHFWLFSYGCPENIKDWQEMVGGGNGVTGVRMGLVIDDSLTDRHSALISSAIISIFALEFRICETFVFCIQRLS